MLNQESNQRLCRVGPDDAMGQAMRRYWLPFMVADGIAVGDDPRGVELLTPAMRSWRVTWATAKAAMW